MDKTVNLAIVLLLFFSINRVKAEIDASAVRRECEKTTGTDHYSDVPERCNYYYCFCSKLGILVDNKTISVEAWQNISEKNGLAESAPYAHKLCEVEWNRYCLVSTFNTDQSREQCRTKTGASEYSDAFGRCRFFTCLGRKAGLFVHSETSQIINRASALELLKNIGLSVSEAEDELNAYHQELAENCERVKRDFTAIYANCMEDRKKKKVEDKCDKPSICFYKKVGAISADKINLKEFQEVHEASGIDVDKFSQQSFIDCITKANNATEVCEIMSKANECVPK